MRNLPIAIGIVVMSGLCLPVTLSAGAGPTTQPGAYNGWTAPPAPAGMSDAYRGYNDYPSAEVQAVPVARAEAARARAEMDLARTQLYRWIDRQWDDFLNSPEFLDAAAAEKRAQQAYDRERDRVLRNLSKDPNYRVLVDLVNDLRNKLDRERPKGKLPSTDEMERMLATAALKLGYSSTASAMEAAALAADSSVQDARKQLTDAGERKSVLRRSFDRSVRRDPQFAAGQADMDQARINRVVSEAFLFGTVNARLIALDYAWYLHRNDYYNYQQFRYYPYPTYNAPYGYGQPGYYGYGYHRRY